MSIETSQDPRAEGRVANLVNVAGNALVCALQLTVGFLSQTQALIADGLHNSGDIFHTLIAWVGFRIAERPADEDHPYGHGNAESVAGILIGLVLLGTGALAVYRGIHSLVTGTYVAQGWIAVGVALVCALIKELLSRRSFYAGNRLNSPTLIAVAQDQRADALTAIGTVCGVAGAMLGFPVLDPVAAVLIGAYVIGFNSFPVLRTNLDVLMDAAPRNDMAQRICERFSKDGEVTRIDSIRIHPLGPYYEVDLEISIDGDLSVRQGHSIAHRVRDQIIEAEKHVREVKVHVNPSPEGDSEVTKNRKTKAS